MVIGAMAQLGGCWAKNKQNFILYPTNAPDSLKAVSYERKKWVRCGHLNAPHRHVQA